MSQKEEKDEKSSSLGVTVTPTCTLDGQEAHLREQFNISPECVRVGKAVSEAELEPLIREHGVTQKRTNSSYGGRKRDYLCSRRKRGCRFTLYTITSPYGQHYSVFTRGEHNHSDGADGNGEEEKVGLTRALLGLARPWMSLTRLWMGSTKALDELY